MELKYGANYTEAFAFKQLARYVHYEVLDVYEQHFARILGVTQIPNPAYAIAITTAFQAAIAHDGIVPNNPDPVPTSVNLSPQQLIAAIANIPPTTDALAFTDPVGEFFRIFDLEFPVKSSEKILQPTTFSRQKDETLKMLYRRLLQTQRGYLEHHRLGSCPSVSSFVGRYSNTPRTGFVMSLCRIWRLVHFARCVQHFRKVGTGSCTL